MGLVHRKHYFPDLTKENASTLTFHNFLKKDGWHFDYKDADICRDIAKKEDEVIPESVYEDSVQIERDDEEFFEILSKNKRVLASKDLIND